MALVGLLRSVSGAYPRIWV